MRLILFEGGRRERERGLFDVDFNLMIFNHCESLFFISVFDLEVREDNKELFIRGMFLLFLWLGLR